jgi:hypothetical protein
VSDVFVRLLRRGLVKVGTQKALGKALGLSKQRISSALAGRGYPFGVLNCLKLARLIGERDWLVLRAAGKPEIADMLEQAYSHRPIRPAPPPQADPDPLDGLSATQRRHILAIVRDLTSGLA